MFEFVKNSTDWIPYKIPRTINRENPNDIYGLSFNKNADPQKNPSQFLEWKKLLPSGENLGDILYWTPSGDEGGGTWTVLSSPQDATEADPKFLSFNGDILWDETEFPRGENFGDLLYWDPNSGDDGAWAILSAPVEAGSIMYWNGNAWQFLSPPSGSTLHALTIQNKNIAWTPTEDCE